MQERPHLYTWDKLQRIRVGCFLDLYEHGACWDNWRKIFDRQQGFPWKVLPFCCTTTITGMICSATNWCTSEKDNLLISAVSSFGWRLSCCGAPTCVRLKMRVNLEITYMPQIFYFLTSTKLSQETLIYITEIMKAETLSQPGEFPPWIPSLY